MHFLSPSLPTGCKLVDLAVRGDERGNLVAIEAHRDIPFAIARVYFIFATKAGVERGFHAHRECRQFAVAVSGSCRMRLDDGSVKADVALDRPDRGILVPPMNWHEMYDFSPDCVLLVAADAPYDEADYIRDYDEFRRLADR